MPKQTSFGVGERGVENGCASPVEVAGGGEAVAEGLRMEGLMEKDRVSVEEGRRADALRRQERQIMVVVL